jgi:hypothetical protein
VSLARMPVEPLYLSDICAEIGVSTPATDESRAPSRD